MSSRLTTPISKLTRSLSTSAAVARPSHLLSNASKAAVSRKQPVVKDEPSAERAHSTAATPHRPTRPVRKTVPFMQTFHHSAPKPLPAAFVPIDRTVLPNLHPDPATQPDPYASIRVPLLPDSRIINAQPETPDEPLLRAQISVVAADPARVLPAALTEVEGMGVDGVELGFIHLLEQQEQSRGEFEMGKGMIRDLWRGMVDDLSSVGSSNGKVAL